MKRFYKKSLYRVFVSFFIIFYSFVPQVIAMDEVINILQEDYAAPIEEEVVIPNEESSDPPIEEEVVPNEEVPIEEEVIPNEESSEVPMDEVEVEEIPVVSDIDAKEILVENMSYPVWEIQGDSATTFEVVELGKTYITPQNSSVKIIFTKLPENPSKLTITELTLTEEEIKATNAISNIAYDFTTDMIDGTFEFDLTLPSYQEDIKVLYSENREDLLDNLKEVDNEILNENGNIKIEDLDHFTIYIPVERTDTLKIMPLGDSITKGSGVCYAPDTYLNCTGYRIHLWNMLVENGFDDFDFVGSQGGTFQYQYTHDNDHEGHGGWTPAGIEGNIYGWLEIYKPDVVLLHIGTNDLNSGDVEDILDKVDDYEDDKGVDVDVVLALIINRKNGGHTATSNFNDAIEAMALARIAAGDDIKIVDMENGAGINYVTDMTDDKHPNDSGYQKMAAAWYKALTNESVDPSCSAGIQPISSITATGVSGPNPIMLKSVTVGSGCYTIGVDDLYTGTGSGVGGSATYPVQNADNFDINNFANTLNPHDIVFFNGDLWVDTNGNNPDFFIFENGGNDNGTIAAIFPDGSFGNPISFNNTTHWGDTGFNSSVGNQDIKGLTFAITDLLDGSGNHLTNDTIIKGLRIASGGLDPSSISAVIVGEPQLPCENTVSGLGTITATGDAGVIQTITYGGETYAPTDLDLGLTKQYLADGTEVPLAWDPPGADGFSFNKNAHTTDSAIYLQTMFAEDHRTFFVFENGGNDDANWYGVKADGTLTSGIFIDASVVAAATGYKTGFGGDLKGFVFVTCEAVRGIRIEDNPSTFGFDAQSISAVPLEDGVVPEESCPSDGDWDKVNDLTGLSYTYTAASGKLVAQTCYKAGTSVVYGNVNPATSPVTVNSTVWNQDGCPGAAGCNYLDLIHASFRLVDVPLTGSIEVTKVVNWGNYNPDISQSFQICIVDSSDSSDCKEVDYDGGVVEWNELVSDHYSIYETDPGSSWLVDGNFPINVSVSAGSSFATTITNTYNPDLRPLCEVPTIIDFDSLQTGEQITNQYNPLGVAISAENNNPSHPNKALVFDSSNPTGGDNDLVTPGYGFNNLLLSHGKIAIIAQNDTDILPPSGFVDDPNDESAGGILNFDFISPVDINEIGLLDIDEGGGQVRIYDETDTLIDSISIPARGDNSYQTIYILESGIKRMEVELFESGALTHLSFCSLTGVISGTKWEDLNGNGSRDAEDLPISGWTINLDKDANGSIDQTTTTDANGVYTFNNLLPGTYKVIENTPSPWNVSYPSAGINYYTGINLTAGDNLTGYDFGNYENGQINGLKWLDVDGDGNKEAGEGVPSVQWQIKLWKEVNGVIVDQGTSVYTDPTTGAFGFGVMPGTYYLSEVLQTGWTQTHPHDGSQLAPDGVTRLLGPIAVTSGSMIENNNFGNFENVSITVCKWEDPDGDINSTGDQTVIPGWSISLIKNNDTVNKETKSTSANGCAQWLDMGPGSYAVMEEDKIGWTNLTPTTHDFGTVQSGSENSFNFINTQQSITINAHKIVCTNESELPNWGVGGPNIDENTGQDWVDTHTSCEFEEGWSFQWGEQSASNPGDNTGETIDIKWHTFGATDTNGLATVEIAAEDIEGFNSIWMREVWNSDYIPFTYNMVGGNSDNVTAEIYCHTDVLNYDNFDRIDNIQNGETYYCVAWNVQYSSIQGRKYYDVNINGDFDKEEKINVNRLDGWTITLYDESWNEVDSMVTGDDTTAAGDVAKGQYRFENVLAGTYYVCEEPQEGWYQTEPSTGVQHPDTDLYCHTVNLQPAENKGDVQFGNYQGSDVKICKQDNYSRPLSGWGMVLASEQVYGPTSINVSNGNGTNSSNLPAGTYLIKVSGTYRYGDSQMIADAGYSYRPKSIPSGCDCWLSGFDLTSGSNGLMAWINDSPVNWGAYDDGHEYTYVYDHLGGPINVSIYDDVYGDNINNGFEFEIFKVNDWAKGTTGRNGCVTLEAVPYGEYILDEYLPMEWIDISNKGLGVTIDEIDERFVIKNRLNSPVTIKATKIVCDYESDLPNWGAIKSDGNPITQARIDQFLEDTEGRCRAVPNWEFEWGYQGAGNPGDELIGYGGGSWNTFGSTNSNGVATTVINNLQGGRIELREVLQENYIPFTYGSNGNNSDNFSAEFYCHNDVMNYDNWEWLNTPEYGETYYCVAFNALKTTDIHGYKWLDVNRNGSRDCLEEETDGVVAGLITYFVSLFEEEAIECQQEPLLSGWKIFVDDNGNSIWDEGEQNMLTDGDGHYGWYWFEDLLPGEYKICEEIPSDWAQTYPGEPVEPQCHTITLPNDCNPYTDDRLETRISTPNAVQTYCEFNFGNVEESQLYISETNDSWPNILSIGDTFTYTITVRALKGPVKDVILTNLPPVGFVPQSGTFSAISDVRGALDVSGVVYSSPGEWNLGDMVENETIVISYTALVTEGVNTGIYPDLTFAKGIGITESEILALSEESSFAINNGIVSEYFVGTQVKVEESEEEEGEVLGASIELPQTGAETYITLGALISMILGLILLVFKPKKLIKSLVITGILLLGIFTLVKPTPTYAVESADISVRIAQPKTPTNSNIFNIGYVVLDLQDRPISVQCYKDGVAFGPAYTANSGECVVNSSVINASGTYNFKVVITAGADIKTSDTVSVQVVLEKPQPVTNYSKSEGTCSYKLSFKSPVSKVQIYRSSKQPFYANSTTLLTSPYYSVTENVLTTYVDDLSPNCNTTYYYAIRTVDDFNNTSKFVTDSIITVVIVPATPTTAGTQTGAPVQEDGVVAGESTEDGADDTEGIGGDPYEVGGDGEVAGESTEDENGQTTEDEDSVENQSFWDEYKYVILFLGLATLSTVGYIYVKRRK